MQKNLFYGLTLELNVTYMHRSLFARLYKQKYYTKKNTIPLCDSMNFEDKLICKIIVTENSFLGDKILKYSTLL